MNTNTVVKNTHTMNESHKHKTKHKSYKNKLVSNNLHDI